MSLDVTLFAIIAPFVVWPIELLLPYPYIVEEVMKWIIVRYAHTRTELSSSLAIALIVGFLFAMSEMALFMYNIVQTGTLSTLFLRLALTIPLHVGTSFVLAYTARRNAFIIALGLATAMLFHYMYNLYVPTLGF